VAQLFRAASRTFLQPLLLPAAALGLVGAVALAVLHAQPPARDLPSLPSQLDTIRGRVVAADTREAVRKARVDLVAPSDQRLDSAYADADGRFTFAGVPPGRYALSAWKSGYVATAFGARTPWEPPVLIAIGPGQSIDGVELQIAKGAAISGRVVDELGEPLSDMQVTVGRSVPIDGRLRFLGVSQATTTDDRGEYRVGGLAPGTFVVNVFGWTGPAAGAAAPDNTPRPHSTFYPQAAFLAQARPIVLRGGEEASSIDVAFTADSTAMPTVSGRVVDPRGIPAQARLVLASDGAGIGSGTRQINTFVQPGGEFAMHVDPGEYILLAQANDLVAVAQVTVERTDITGIELVLAKGARVSGRVLFEGTSPRPPEGFIVAARGRDQRLPIDPSQTGGQPARVRADGSFVMSSVIGACELRVMPEGRGWRPKSITAAGRNLLDVPLEFKGGEELRDVLIVMTDRTAELIGTIAGTAQSVPATELSVLVFAEDPRQVPRRAHWVRPDQTGRFVVSNLSPGSYLVALASDVDDALWQTAAYLDRFRPNAQRVAIADGETKSVTLEWTPPR
jgi:Carboxypeptidase regulatory-like domain